MALYFDSTLDCPSGSATTCLNWHAQFELIAVGYCLPEKNGGIVNCYNGQGIIQHNGSLMMKNVVPTTLSWHSTKKILAVGWDNGEITLWNGQDKEIHAASQLHSSSISTMVWTSRGSRIGSCDKEGVFACWKVDSRGRLQHDPLYRVAFDSAICDCVCKPGPAGSGDPDMSDYASLAKAAVSGDEKALDLFASVQTNIGGRLKMPAGRKEGLTFYIGLSNGLIYYVDEKGSKKECVQLDAATQQLLYLKKQDFLISVSANLQVVQCRVHADGKAEIMEQFKLSGVDGGAKIVSVGNGLLAAATSDQFLRMWSLVTGDNFTLALKESLGFADREQLTTVAYCKSKSILAAVTNHQRIAIWKTIREHSNMKLEAEESWQLQPSVKLNSPCTIIMWYGSSSVLAAGGPAGAYLLTEQKPKSALSITLAATQTGPQQITVEFIGQKQTTHVVGLNLSPQRFGDIPLQPNNAQIVFNTEMNFSGLDVASDHLATWNGHHLLVYELNVDKETLVGNFECNSSLNALHDHSVFTVETSKSAKALPKIQVRNFQGTVKQLISLQENEGRPTVITVTGNFMVYGTSENYMRVFDLTRRDAKPHCNSKRLKDLIQEFGSISSLRCNATGSKVAITCLKDNSTPDSKVYVYDVELDRVESFDFLSGTNDYDEFGLNSGPKTDVEQSRADAASEVAGRYPVNLRWDALENRLLCCEARITDAARVEQMEANERRSTMSFVSNLSLNQQLIVAYGTSNIILLSKAIHILRVNEKLENKMITMITQSSTASAHKHPCDWPEIMVVSLFVTQDYGILLQDSYPKTERYDNLIGLKVPYFYFTQQMLTEDPQKISNRPDASADRNRAIARKTMRDFVGLDNTDDMSQKAMLDFSYFLTIGDMDEAFKAIKLIKGAAVWESMARMCVKTRRLDVAKVCLAHMGHARGARALREAEKEPERDARVARLALELGMNDEAERLYRNCDRFDLLNQFYQSTGQWEKAIEIASQLDRVHLRTTFYNFAKHLEASGNIQDAISNYEKSGNHYFEVPRMLFDDTQVLEAYVMKSKDRKLRKWWAQYMESTGEMEAALKFYKQAADPLSLVRVHCYCGNVEKAAEIANETGDRAACYHLARQFENNNDFKQAIHFFTRAMAYGNAIRICKENGFEDQLMNLALLSTPSDMVEAAKYYEDRPDTIDKSVLLYHKAGHFSEALELAFESQQYAALELISQELDDRTDPVLLERCADFFTEHEQHDRAVSMLVAAKRFEEAISVCYDHNVRLNESLVEKLTLPKDAFDKPTRDRLLIKLGDCCMKQAEYHLACQKYTQAGDKEKAMRALLKSGDTEKIIFFAGVSRTKSIYVMAANYLQSLDWRKDPEIMKNIISFYTKGRSLDSLAGFYDACAQVEIDEYQNYDKALGALNEAFKCLTKAKMANQEQQEIKITELKTRIALVKKFIHARRMFQSDPEEGIKQCHNLLMETDLEASVRYGDVYGLLIEYYATRENYEKSYHYMQELRSRMPSVALSYFVNVATIEAVHSAVGAPLSRTNLANGDGRKIDEVSDDDVAEEIFNPGF